MAMMAFIEAISTLHVESEFFVALLLVCCMTLYVGVLITLIAVSLELHSLKYCTMVGRDIAKLTRVVTLIIIAIQTANNTTRYIKMYKIKSDGHMFNTDLWLVARSVTCSRD